MFRLATLFILLALPAAAESINTTELDGAMNVCRQHIVPGPSGEYVFAKGWEDCNAVNLMWQSMRGASPLDPAVDKAKVREFLNKRAQ